MFVPNRILCMTAAMVASLAQAHSPDTGDTPDMSVDAPITVSVPYVTNRERRQGLPPEDTYSGERGKPHFGQCAVEFSPVRMISGVALSAPFYVPRETNELSLAEQEDSAVFWDRLVDSVARTSSGSVVLFVHGYNYGFERTCRMAAELQRSLQDKATVLMLSWPSNGRPTDYVADQADVEWSVPFIVDTIQALAERFGAENVQVLAHSLGSRGVMFALERLRADRRPAPVAHALTLVAPDFDSQVFVSGFPRVRELVGNATLYASNSDAALKTSRTLHGYPRLGEAGEYLTVMDRLETIDVSPSGRYEILGHEYFHFQPHVRADLAMLLGDGKRAAERPGLVERRRNGLPYWEIPELP